jgi:DNA-binding NarL/FixJ family response regulator
MDPDGARYENGAAASALDAQAHRSGTAAAITRRPIAFIDPLRLTRECIVEQLAKTLPELRIVSFSDVGNAASSWKDAEQPSCVIYNSHSLSAIDARISSDLLLLRDMAIRVVLLSDNEETDNVVRAMGHGLAGYVPTALSVEVVSEAIRLVVAGGIYIPASVLAYVGSPASPRYSGSVSGPNHIRFTPRQLEVLRHLWEGKQNKVIARDLGLSEGTIKVHLKQIMKKVSAHNRTQTVLITQQIVKPRPTPSTEKKFR